MAKIRLPERTALPPDRAGKAKPSFSLADQGNIGGGLSAFAGKVFEKIVTTRAANEEAEFHGQAEALIEGFRTDIAKDPGLSFEDLQKLRDKVMTSIQTASQKATTGIAKGNNARWMSLNRDVISAKLQTSVEAIVSKQESDRFSANTTAAIRDLKPEELRKLYKDTDLFDDETKSALFENDMSRLAERQAIVDARNERERIAAELRGAIESRRIAAQAEKVAKQAKKDKRDLEFQGEYDALTTMALGTPAIPSAEPTITNQEEYDALSSGALYIDSNGNRGRKP